MCACVRACMGYCNDIVVPQGSQHCMLKFHVTTETWVIVFSPEEGSSTMVQEDHLHKGKGCPVGSDRVIGFLPDRPQRQNLCNWYVD